MDRGPDRHGVPCASGSVFEEDRAWSVRERSLAIEQMQVRRLESDGRLAVCILGVRQAFLLVPTPAAQLAAEELVGQHDFSSFRGADCQAK